MTRKHFTETIAQGSAPSRRDLPVRLGDALELVLLLDRERVGRPLGRVHQFIGQALGDGLDVAGITSIILKMITEST